MKVPRFADMDWSDEGKGHEGRKREGRNGEEGGMKGVDCMVLYTIYSFFFYHSSSFFLPLFNPSSTTDSVLLFS